MTDGKVRLVRDGAVVTILFDRPQARNAWGEDYNSALKELLPQIEDDPGIRCVILTGDEAGGARWAAEVGGKADRPVSDLLGGSAGGVGIARVEDNLRAGGGQRARNRQPDAAARAGHKRRAAFQCRSGRLAHDAAAAGVFASSVPYSEARRSVFWVAISTAASRGVIPRSALSFSSRSTVSCSIRAAYS